MILVDTSVLIDFLKGAENDFVSLLEEILDRRIPYGINEFIYQEILQGSKDIAEFNKLKKYFETVVFYHLKNEKKSYEEAAFIHFSCRRAGITIRSTIDLLIVQTAIENNLYLLHKDEDFNKIARVVPELKILKKELLTVS
ncbi:MAG: PIN domain nuclease [Deltaproteobacteria bacterium]|nr:PIN domain nuclease [Deltaproteobacteria bacterium]